MINPKCRPISNHRLTNNRGWNLIVWQADSKTHRRAASEALSDGRMSRERELRVMKTAATETDTGHCADPSTCPSRRQDYSHRDVTTGWSNRWARTYTCSVQFPLSRLVHVIERPTSQVQAKPTGGRKTRSQTCTSRSRRSIQSNFTQVNSITSNPSPSNPTPSSCQWASWILFFLLLENGLQRHVTSTKHTMGPIRVSRD
jgi:hypothetical protein